MSRALCRFPAPARRSARLRRTAAAPCGHRLHGDGGQVGGIEVLPLGILTFVVGGLLLANAWAVVDAHSATSSAARAAVRAAAESTDTVTAQREGTEAARAALAGLGRDVERLSITLHADRPFGRCARLTATAQTWVDAIALPWVGGFGQRFEITASATEVVDPLREGLTGAADCLE